MIQDLVASRDKFHKDRGTEFTGKPAAPYLFDRTPDAILYLVSPTPRFFIHM
jgi:hypothetical protein